MHREADNNDLICDLPDGSRVVVVGLGGIGTALLQPLAVFLHSLQVPLRLVLVDGDKFEPQNGARQLFRALGNKAEVKAAETLELLGTSEISVAPLPDYLSQDNLQQSLRDGDYVFLCVDNHETRKLVSDHVQLLANVVLISGGNEGYDPPRELGTYGTVQIAVRRNGQDLTVPITHYHPEIAQADGQPPHELAGCGQLIQSSPQLIFTNLAVASAMLSAFFAYTCNRLTYQETQLDILAARMLPQFSVAIRGAGVPIELGHGQV